MLNRLIGWAPTLSLAYLSLPAIMFFTRGRLGTARLAYLVFSSNSLGLTRLAATTSAVTFPLIDDSIERALLRMCSARLSFDAGYRIDEWERECSDALALCDHAIAQDEQPDIVVDLLHSALLVLFHPAVHQSKRPSPFIDDPDGTFALMNHPCIRALATPPKRYSPVPSDRIVNFYRGMGSTASGSSCEIPAPQTKLLVLTDTNFNFAGPMLRSWNEDPTVELRVRDLRAEGIDSSWWHPKNTIRDRLGGFAPAPPSYLVDDLEWADVVFVEWSEAIAARLSGVDLSARLVVRLHRYEAFTPSPMLTAWGKVDTLITITPYMSELLDRVVPGIAEQTTISMIPNVTDLRRFQLSKSAKATRTVGLVQFSKIVKDPLWALDTLAHLRAQDPSWKLALIGQGFSPEGASAEERDYFARFDARAREFGDAIEFLGHRDDLPIALRDIGVILSTSQVEGSPVSIQEGLASGAFPVIRDWPMLRGLGAARSLYPEEWIVQTPEEAAARIIAWSSTVKSTVDEAASRTATLAQSDASVTMPLLDQVVFQRGASTAR